MKLVGAIASVILCIVGVLFAIIGIGVKEPAAIILGASIALVFFGLYKTIQKKRREEKTRIAEIGKEQYKQEKREAARAAAVADRILDYVLIAGQESKTSASSAVARGAVGSALLGPVGLLAAAGAKKNTDVTLVLHYKSSRTETKTVKLNSKEFKKLTPYMK